MALLGNLSPEEWPFNGKDLELPELGATGQLDTTGLWLNEVQAYEAGQPSHCAELPSIASGSAGSPLGTSFELDRPTTSPRLVPFPQRYDHTVEFVLPKNPEDWALVDSGLRQEAIRTPGLPTVLEEVGSHTGRGSSHGGADALARQGSAYFAGSQRHPAFRGSKNSTSSPSDSGARPLVGETGIHTGLAGLYGHNGFGSASPGFNSLRKDAAVTRGESSLWYSESAGALPQRAKPMSKRRQSPEYPRRAWRDELCEKRTRQSRASQRGALAPMQTSSSSPILPSLPQARTSGSFRPRPHAADPTGFDATLASCDLPGYEALTLPRHIKYMSGMVGAAEI